MTKGEKTNQMIVENILTDLKAKGLIIVWRKSDKLNSVYEVFSQKKNFSVHSSWEEGSFTVCNKFVRGNSNLRKKIEGILK